MHGIGPNNVRTWIEIDAMAAKRNYDTFRKLIGPQVKLWSVVKSNAYGHGIYAFSKLAEQLGVDGFCVDSIVEGIALRKSGIKKPILVLGSTLSERLEDAVREDITVSVSSKEGLAALAKLKKPPQFHLKIDTGMHRQGVYPSEIPNIIRTINSKKLEKKLAGIFTHFASAKDINYTTYTDMQCRAFEEAAEHFKKAGFRRLVKHAAATGGTVLGSKYHFDAVRVGIGLYGLWPSKELEMQLGQEIVLRPILSWRSLLVQRKIVERGEYVGYDLAERVLKRMMIGIMPIGYWHGFPRIYSNGTGEVIIRGSRVKTVGRVSMDMATLGPLPRNAKMGDVITLVGKDGAESITAYEAAQQAGTTHYEFLTRLNPLIERVVT